MPLRTPIGAVEMTAGHDCPVVIRYELPVSCEHLLAWPVTRERFDAIRGGLRALLERGDLGPLTEHWKREAPAYLAERQRRRWRLPRERLASIFASALEVWSRIPEEDRDDFAFTDSKGSAIEPPGIHAMLVHGASERTGTVEASPGRWLTVEHRAEFLSDARIESGLSTVLVGLLIVALCDLEKPTRKDALFTGPEGDVRWLAELTFHEEDSGARVEAAEDLPNPQRDRALWSGAPDAYWTPGFLVGYLQGLIGIDWFIDAAMGPWEPSRGPGPAQAMPEEAIALQDPSWDVLPVFRSGTRRGSPPAELAVDWFVLEGDALAAVADGEPRVPEQDDGPPSGWQGSLSGSPAEALRERFRRLLREQHASGGVVLLTARYPNAGDQARDASWGELAR